MKAVRAARALLALGALLSASTFFGASALGSSGSSHQRDHRSAKRACRCTGHRTCARPRSHTNAKRKPRKCVKRKRVTRHTAPKGSAPSPKSSVPSLPAQSSTPGSSSATTAPGGTPAPPETPTAPAAPAHVEVTAEDTGALRFVLSRPIVPAGKVIIDFINRGQDEHNLNVVAPVEGSVEGSIPNTDPGAHPSISLTMRPGSYRLFCSIADHEAKGMKATLTVK